MYEILAIFSYDIPLKVKPRPIWRGYEYVIAV